MQVMYSEALAHQIYAAADIILVPSLYEPCGLTQLVGMRYGAIPIVRSTGGLADTVTDIDSGNNVSNLARVHCWTKASFQCAPSQCGRKVASLPDKGFTKQICRLQKTALYYVHSGPFLLCVLQNSSLLRCTCVCRS